MSNANKKYDIGNVLPDLLRHLSARQEVAAVLKKFSALKSNAERVDFVYNLLDANHILPVLIVDEKNNERAANLRQEGNEMFEVHRYREAAEFYTKSIACGEEKSECLAFAYANRSAVMFEGGFYEECLVDIVWAFENNYPRRLKPKLLARQEKAVALKSKQTPRNYFEPIPTIPQGNKNAVIDCAADSVEIRTSEDLGRHVVAARDIAIGEVLAIEKPFCHVLHGKLYSHCHECLKLCYNLIPCENCTQVLYCSAECRFNAKYYHVYECPILATMESMELDKSKLLPLKIVLSVKDQFQTIREGYGNEGTDLYKSDRYKEVHSLFANTEKRSVSDLLDRAVIASVVFHLIKAYTPFFDQEEEETVFKELLLLHLQIAACNSVGISELAVNNNGIYDDDGIAGGVYSFLSMFNHSCSCNIGRSFHGPVAVLMAVKSIKKGDQCFVSYGCNLLMSKSQRRAKLKKQFYFDCSCEACRNDWPLYPNLPEIRTNFRVEYRDIIKLQKGDVNAAKIFLAENIPQLVKLDKLHPNVNFLELQEAIKQCYAILGNMRRTW